MRRILSSTSVHAFAVVLATSLGSASAAAQATGDSDTEAVDAQEGVEEIVVTATRRTENLQ